MADTKTLQALPPATTTFADDDSIKDLADFKAENAHVEAVQDQEALTSDAKADYSGFAQKTDPAEIKLVRKLDVRIMLSLWSMYWLNYLVSRHVCVDLRDV